MTRPGVPTSATGFDLAFLTGVEGTTQLTLVRHGEQDIDRRTATVGATVSWAPWRTTASAGDCVGR